MFVGVFVVSLGSDARNSAALERMAAGRKEWSLGGRRGALDGLLRSIIMEGIRSTCVPSPMKNYGGKDIEGRVC